MPFSWQKCCILGLAAVSFGLLSGCSGGAGSGQREDRDPQIRRARERRAAGDYDGAIELYTRALDRKPDLASAHLEIGLLFDQEKHDDLRALYHYQRYMEMRPSAEKRELVEKLIQHARLSFASSLPDRPSEAVREIEMLRREVKTLRDLLGQKSTAPVTTSVARVAAAPVRPVAPRPGAPVPAPIAPSAPATPVVAAPATPSEKYVVRAGDTLSRIATRVYNDASKRSLIFEANRHILSTPESLKIGQVLIIPRGGGS